MDYKIVSVDHEAGQIQVAYSHAGVDISTLPIDLPLVDGEFPSGHVLDAEIQARAPVWLLDRKAEAVAVVGFSSVLGMVSEPVAPPVVVPATEDPTA